MATLKAEKREGKGKYKAFDLRKAGAIPGVVYGKGIADNLKISVNRKEFELLLKSGEHIVDLDLDGGVRKVLIKMVQHGTYDHEILHADFRAIREDEVVEVELLIELAGEAAGVKQGGLVEHSLHQIHVRCLPKDMPERIVADISGLDVGDILYAGDLPKLPGVAYLVHGNPAVASCRMPAGDEAPAEGGEAQAAPEVIGEKEREARESGDK